MNAQSVVIKAQRRETASKGVVSRQRKSGIIPGVLYSKGSATKISVPAQNLPKQHTKTEVIELDLEGQSKRVIMREVQVNPLNDLPVHFDFQEVSDSDVVRAHVPLDFVGLTREQEKDGTFGVLLRYLEVKSKVSELPKSLAVDVSQLKAGQSVRLFDLSLPKGLVVRTGKGKNVALASIIKA